MGLDDSSTCNGWLSHAPKEEIVNWLKTNILARLHNAYDNAVRDATGKDPRDVRKEES